MPNGNSPPYISQDAVRAALDCLLYASTPRPPSPLQRLLIVDESLVNPDLPPGPNVREFTLNRILVSLIHQEYGRLRSLRGLGPPEPDDSLEITQAGLSGKIPLDSPELLSWGVLYYRFVRADLELRLDTLSTLLHVDERTLRRYQQHGILRLTGQLTQLEWNARVRQRKRRLLGELPATTATPLFGRDSAFQEVERALGGQPPHHMLITGAAGIGKTSFVQGVLLKLIELDQLDHLVWIGKPPSLDFIKQT